MYIFVLLIFERSKEEDFKINFELLIMFYLMYFIILG